MADRYTLIREACSSRKGRMTLAHSMVDQTGQSNWDQLPCHRCALRDSKDCEKMRLPSERVDCMVPGGTIPVVDEREEP